jgi:hypothetical protein
VKQTIFTGRAILDIQKAKNWYEKQQKHLGKKFVEDVLRIQKYCKNNLLYNFKPLYFLQYTKLSIIISE